MALFRHASVFTHADDSYPRRRQSRRGQGFWLRLCVCVGGVCVFVCLQCREKTTGGIDLKLDLMLVHDDPKPPINFGGQRSRSQGQKRSKFYFCHFSLFGVGMHLFQCPLVYLFFTWPIYTSNFIQHRNHQRPFYNQLLHPIETERNAMLDAG